MHPSERQISFYPSDPSDRVTRLAENSYNVGILGSVGGHYLWANFSTVRTKGDTLGIVGIENYIKRSYVWTTFSTVWVFALAFTKKGWAIFRVIFSKTYLVTLTASSIVTQVGNFVSEKWWACLDAFLRCVFLSQNAGLLRLSSY
jgi:hypothetical protein